MDIKEILKQEKKAELPHFSIKDLDSFIKTIKYVGGSSYNKVCILIKINQRVVFFHAGNNTTNENNDWVNKKSNVVDLFDHSSLYEKLLHLDEESDFYTDNGLNRKEYAIVGGGFPISITNTGIIGSIVISGLTDDEDHNFAFRSLLTFKNILSR